MLLTLTTTHAPATDLGYLLHKNPARSQSFHLNFGNAQVFYPEVSEEKCTAAMMLDIDPVALVRNRRGPAGEGFSLEQYVNDRPYVASSFLSVAISQVFGSALSLRIDDWRVLYELDKNRIVILDIQPRGGLPMKTEIIERKGRRFAVVPLKEFERLKHDAEMMGDIHAYDSAKTREEEAFPSDVARRLVAGESPIRVFREYRGLTQERLAKSAKIARAYLAELESGRKHGSIAVLRAVATALKLDLDDIAAG